MILQWNDKLGATNLAAPRTRCTRDEKCALIPVRTLASGRRVDDDDNDEN